MRKREVRMKGETNVISEVISQSVIRDLLFKRIMGYSLSYIVTSECRISIGIKSPGQNTIL